MHEREWQDHYPVETRGRNWCNWAELVEKYKLLIRRLAATRRDPPIRAR